jgi:valyl-tRNA synthetase
VLPNLKVYIPLAGVIDIDKEILRHQKKIDKLNKRIETAEKKLGNADFTKRAPGDVVEREEEALAELKTSREEIEKQIESLRG